MFARRHPAPVAWVAASSRIKATLVIAAPSLLSQWARECRHRAPQLKVLEYGLQATDGVLRQRGSRDADLILCATPAAGAWATTWSSGACASTSPTPI